jgi:hypothetical protein
MNNINPLVTLSGHQLRQGRITESLSRDVSVIRSASFGPDQGHSRDTPQYRPRIVFISASMLVS